MRDGDWDGWAREHAQRVEGVLEQALATRAQAPGRLCEAMRYATLGGGKRIRALLVYASAELVRGDAALADAPAAALEMIHAYSLVHDDLPCMDDDVLRRGKPTCHVAFGEAVALLAGDALQTLAFEVLAGSGMRDAAGACALLAQAAGAQGMAGGQAIDLESVGQPLSVAALETMHRLKTGALIRAAVQLGARCGTAPDAATSNALDRYAAAAGLAFQVVDDVLDVEGSATTLGKTAGKDAAQGKPTYVTLLGLDAARSLAGRLREEARAALAPCGERGQRLVELADWITLRRN